MLTYCARGHRRYDLRPIYPYCRDAWEFQASIAGPLIATQPYGGDSQAQERHLWLWSPDASHGWTTPPGASCTIISLHFNPICAPLAKRAQLTNGLITCQLEDTDISLLNSCYERAQAHRPARGARSQLHYQHIMLELSIWLLEKLDNTSQRQFNEPQDDHTVTQALSWFAAHLHTNPTLAQTASAMGLSVAHFRRLCHASRRCSPQQACLAIRMRRAEELLRQQNLNQSAIAEACGYADAASFNRAFTREHGVSPQVWAANEVR